MTHREVLRPGSIYLGSRHPTTGAVLREGHFMLVPETKVVSTFQGLSPPVIAIGDQGRDSQPFASTATFADCSGGIGVLHNDPAVHVNRVWWATTDIRYRRQVTLLKRKVDKGAPPGITTEVPRRGGVFNDKVWTAWNHRVRQWSEGAGDTIAIASSTNASPIAVTTSVNHGYVSGWTVTIAGHTINTNANGTWVIVVTSPTTFTLTGSTGNGVGGAVGTANSVFGGWTAGATTGDRLLTGSSTPANDPLEFESGWFWPLGAGGIDYWNGAAWTNIAKSCVGLMIYGDRLWGVAANGQVFSTNISGSAAAAKIAAATFAAADFTDRVRVSDTCSGLIAYTTADSADDIVPYIIGLRTLYQVDAAGAAPSYTAIPSGPRLPPNRWPIRAVVSGGDNALYIAQGNGVIQWTGNIARDAARAVGLDSDDGVPVEYRGGIVQILDSGQGIFALIDATLASGATTLDIYGTGPSEDGVLTNTLGYSWLASREGDGWVVRAISDVSAGAATGMFISTAQSTYRIWYSWNGRLYATDLEQSLYNPIDDPTGEYEPGGDLYYSALDFGYHIEDKIALLAQVETDKCNANEMVLPYIQYELSGSWYKLYNADGSGHGISTNGLHNFLVAANPSPVTTNPLVFADDPPAGKQHRVSQLWLHMQRGATVTATPKVLAAILHVIKSVPALTGFQVTLDLSDEFDNQTPRQQRDLLLNLLADSEAGLLHFAYLADTTSATPGASKVWPVKITGVSGLDDSGRIMDYQGRVRLSLSEVRHVA